MVHLRMHAHSYTGVGFGNAQDCVIALFRDIYRARVGPSAHFRILIIQCSDIRSVVVLSMLWHDLVL